MTPITTTPRHSLPLMQAGQASKHITHNVAIAEIDARLHIRLDTRGQSAPPVDPASGTVHLVGADPTGAWSGQGGTLAQWLNGGWVFRTPDAGWTAYDVEAGVLLVFDGTWTPLGGDDGSGGTPERTARLGIGTDADSSNRLAVASDSTLFTHMDGAGGHRMAINRAGTGDVASLIFQTGYTAWAEMGLADSGSEDSAFSIRAFDGAVWRDALRVDPATARVSFPSGGAREQLSAPRTYHVATGGSDGADGLTAGTAFATLQRAVEAAQALDPAGHRVTVQLAPGTYPAPTRITRPLFDAGELALRGDVSDPGATRLATGDSPALFLQGGTTRVDIQGLHIEGLVGLWARSGARVQLGGANSFGPCAARQIGADNGAYIEITGELALSGVSGHAVFADAGGHVLITAATLALADGTNFHGGFVRAVGMGLASIYNIALSGAATGPAYHVTLNAALNTLGQSASVLPGDSPGIVESGGQVG